MKRSAATWTTLAQQYVMDDTNVPAGTTNSPGTVNMLLGFTDRSCTITPGPTGIGEALVSPYVANGRIYVPADGTVMVLGLH